MASASDFEQTQIAAKAAADERIAELAGSNIDNIKTYFRKVWNVSVTPTTNATLRDDLQKNVLDEKHDMMVRANMLPPNFVITTDAAAVSAFASECVARAAVMGQEMSDYYTMCWVHQFVLALDAAVDEYLGIPPDASAATLSASST